MSNWLSWILIFQSLGPVRQRFRCESRSNAVLEYCQCEQQISRFIESFSMDAHTNFSWTISHNYVVPLRRHPSTWRRLHLQPVQPRIQSVSGWNKKNQIISKIYWIISVSVSVLSDAMCRRQERESIRLGRHKHSQDREGQSWWWC